MSLTIIGDNSAVLAWADKNKVKSHVCVNKYAAVNFSLLHASVTLVEARPKQYLPVEIGLVNVLSRGDPNLTHNTSQPPSD